MSKRFIIFITIIISLALIGLISIQAYWIGNAINLKEINFNRSVNEALSQVVDKIERIEIANQITQKRNFYNRGSSLIISIDSLNYLYYKELEAINRASVDKPIDQSFESVTIRIAQNPDSIIDPDQVSKQRLNELLRRKSLLINDVFEDMFTFSHFQDIENRIDTCILDSLITLELLNKGIDTDYEYGIFSPSRNRMVIEKTGNYSKKLLENNLAFILFPSDVFSNPDYLMIYFPHERKFLFKQLSGILSISVFLILIIIVSFLFTINFIFKEKKFAEMKTDFINNMTHEFKTPISTIALACEALKDKDLKMIKDVSDSYISIVNEENKRLGAMAEKILQTAVLEKGKLKLNKEKIDIHHIIFDVIKNIGIQVEINDGRIVKDFRASNPVIEADKVHLTNVIFNLLENANKYSPIKPLITIRTKNIPGGIEVSVKDNGVGINKSDQKKIFDKLYRVPTGDIHNFKGFGLGLSYVKAIVAKHGGTVTLESEINVGSTFRVFIPEK